MTIPINNANNYDEGYITDGPDGVTYIVKTFKNGTNKWIKTDKPKPSVESESDTDTEIVEEKPKAVVTEKKTRAKKVAVNGETEKPKKTRAKKFVEKTLTEDGETEQPKKLQQTRTKKVDKPKKAPTAYNIFIGEQLRKLRKEDPTLPQGEYMKLAGAIWRGMTDEQKKTLTV